MKKIKKIFLLVGLIVFTIINSKIIINAKTNYEYNISFNYVLTYIVNTQSKEISSGENVSNVEIVDSYGSNSNLNILFKCNKELNNDIIENNSFIKCNEIDIIINSGYENCEIYLYDSFNNIISSSGINNLYLSELVDDNYKLVVLLSGRGNLIDNRTYEMYKTTCEFSFTVDTKPPIIEGASLNMDGMYINSSFNIKAIDSSGINRVYMLEPGSFKYEEIDTNETILPTKNGLVTFYAYDNAGNMSSLYYVYFDTEKPTGAIYSTDNENINSNYTDLDFYYKGNDSYSKIDYMLYKTPNSEEFVIYDGQIIYNTYQEGYYEFKTIDKSGNESDITKIYLYQNVNPVKLKTIENSNKVYLTWENDNYTILVNNENYIKNTIIENEGDYIVEIENELGFIYYISFTVSCYYEFTIQKEATCVEEGYKLYNCISCSNFKKTDIKNKGPHEYSTKEVKPTCTTEGGILFYCIYCDESYLTQLKPKLEHSFYTYISVLPTCTENGQRTYVCQMCGYQKHEEVLMKGHSFTYLEDIEEQGDQLRLMICSECQIIETEKLIINKDKILGFINNIINIYFKYITLILIITSSIWSLFIGVLYIIKNKKDEQINIKKMIINYIIGIIIIFIIMLALPYLINGIIKTLII